MTIRRTERNRAAAERRAAHNATLSVADKIAKAEYRRDVLGLGQSVRELARLAKARAK